MIIHQRQLVCNLKNVWLIGDIVSVCSNDRQCKCKWGAVRYLKDRLSTWRDDSLVLNGDYMHVHCCAHILNLILNEGLKEVNASIVSFRNAMKYVRSSTTRMQAFQIRVNQEKINCKGSVILDCPTRWNSTYSMLSTTLKFKSTFDQMENED